MSNTEAVIKYDREQMRALYQKATQLGTAVFKNKTSFISDVEVAWFGAQNNTFPFAIDKELNVCTRMPHQRVLDKFRSAIFQEPPANSGICTVKVRNTLCGYVVLRGVNDREYNVLKTVEYLLQWEWVGVVHTSDGAKLYLLPTSSLTHHLGITSPDCVYPRILHGLFVRKEKKVKRSVSSGSTSSSFVATPLPLLSQTSLVDLSGDKAAQAPPTTTIATAKSTPKKRKVVSFADLPSSSIDDGNDKSDVIVISSDLDAIPPLAPTPSASSGSEGKVETKQKQVDIPQVTVMPAPLAQLKKSVTAALEDGGDVATSSSQEAGKSDDRSHLPSPLREILSDEESIASSVSSFTSDSSTLLERPTRRRRGGRRRGGGRGKKVVLAQDQRTQEDADLAGGEPPKTRRRGGRGRRRGWRGARNAPELTRSCGVETVEDSLKAEVAEKMLYELLKQDSVSIIQVEQSKDDPPLHPELDTTTTPAAAASSQQSASSTHTHAAATVEKSVEEEMDIVTLPQKQRSDVEEVQQLTKQPGTRDSPVKGEKIGDERQQDLALSQDTCTVATAQTDQSVITPETVSLQNVERQEEAKEKLNNITEGGTSTALEVISVAMEEHVMEQEKEGAAEIEQEVISQDGALGHMDEFIVMDSGGGQYVRPPKRVTLAEYIKRRKVTDSTSSESSQPMSEREAVVHTKLLRSSATCSEKMAALEASAQDEAEGGSQRRSPLSPLSEAISEAMKAEVLGSRGQIRLEKRAIEVEKDSIVKSKEAVSAVEKVSKRLSPILPPLTLKKVDVHAASEPSKSDTTQASKIPVSSRATPQQPHRFGSPISTPLPPHPTSFSSMLSTHPAAPSHLALAPPAAPSAAAAASWSYGSYSHLFFPQASGIGSGLTQAQDHWPFSHQFYVSGGAGPQSASPLDFPTSLRSLGFDDIPPPPPTLMSPDHHMIPRSRSTSRSRSHSQSRSRSRTRSRSRSRSRTTTRSRSKSRSITRSPRSVSRSRSRSPLIRTHSRRSRSQSRSRSHNKSPRRSRGRGASRSRTPSTPDRLTTAVMQQLSEHLSVHLLQTIQVQEQKKEFGVQASPSTSSLGAQIGSGFKLRSISSQTHRPARCLSRGIQCSSRTRGMGIQTHAPNCCSTQTQTRIKKRNVGCQTGSIDGSGPSSPSNIFEALLQNSDQDFSEFTEILEDAKRKFAEAIGLTLDDISDDESCFDISSSPEDTSSVDVHEEGHQEEDKEEGGDKDANSSQHMAPSPVISGASNISDGEWSDLEGSLSNSNSRKPSESATPTHRVSTNDAVQLQDVADALLSPTKPKGMDAGNDCLSSKSKSPIPVPPSPPKCSTPPPATSAYSLACDPSESPPFCSPMSMVISPIAESDIDEILIEEQKRAETQTSKEPTGEGEGCSTTDKPPVSVVESGKQSNGQIALSEDAASSKKTALSEGAASSKKIADNSSIKEHRQQRSSTPIDIFGPSLPPDLPQTTAYGPALPPSTSPELHQQQSALVAPAAAAADTPAPAYGPPLPPPRTSYDVPLPPTYGPALPPFISRDNSRSLHSTGEIQADNDRESLESQAHGEAVKDKEEEVMTDTQGVWHIRSISLPPFKMSDGSTPSSNSNSNSGRSTPLISNKSTPLSSPGDDGSKSSEQLAKHHPKSVSPQSMSRTVSSDLTEKSKGDSTTSAKPASDGKKRQMSSGRDSDEQTFKSPRKRKRSRRHDSPEERRLKGQETPKEKRIKKGSSSDDSSDGGGGGSSSAASEPKAKSRPDTLTTKKLQEALDSSSLMESVRKAASSSPPSSNSKKFGSDPVLFPVKKKPILTAQELLEKVRAKKLKSPEEGFKPLLRREGQQGSPVSTPQSPGCSIGQGSILLSPPFASEPAGRPDSTFNAQELMMKFHQHMAAKKRISQDSSWLHHGVPMQPASPFVGPPPPPPCVSSPSLVHPSPRPPPSDSGIGISSPNFSSMSSGDISSSQVTQDPSRPMASSPIDTSKTAAASEGDSEEDDIDAQLEAVLDSHITKMRSKCHSPSIVSSPTSAKVKELISSEVHLPKPSKRQQPSGEGEDSSSPLALAALLSSKQSATPTSSEHFLAAELVQHSSSEKSGTVEPAVITEAARDSHFPTNKSSADRKKTKDSSDKGTKVPSNEGSKDRRKAEPEQHPNPSATSEQLKKQLASPSFEQQTRILKHKSTGARSTIATTPDRPMSIMYQSSVLDPISPTGLSDNSPIESNVGQTMSVTREEVEQDDIPEHTTSESHIRESACVMIKVSEVGDVVLPGISMSSGVEKKMDVSVKGGKDKACGNLGHVSTEDDVSSDCPQSNTPTPEAGDALPDQSKDTSAKLMESTTQQLGQASCDPVCVKGTIVTASTVEHTGTVGWIESDAAAAPVELASLSKNGHSKEQCQDEAEVDSDSQAPVHDVCQTGESENVLTEQFPTEQGVPPDKNSKQSPDADTEGVDRDDSDLAATSIHSIQSTVSKPSQESQVEAGTKAGAGCQEIEQTPLGKESVQESTKCQQSREQLPVRKRQKQEPKLEMVAQLEESPEIEQEQLHIDDAQKMESQSVSEKSIEDDGSRSANKQEDSNGDLHPSPEEDLGGQRSRDLSPETFRRGGNEEVPELTDTSREDFVVSRSPSFSPSKPPTCVSSSTHNQITAAIQEVVSTVLTVDRDTHTLSLIGTQTSNLELSDIQEGDTDTEVFLHVKDSSPEEQSFSDTLRHSSCTSDPFADSADSSSSTSDPFADSADICSSPLRVSSESPERQLPDSVTVHIKDSSPEEQSFSDASRRSSCTSDPFADSADSSSSTSDPFVDSADSSPLLGPRVSSESPERQLPHSVKDCSPEEQSFNDASRHSSSTSDPFADSTDSSPLQSPSESPERQLPRSVKVHVTPETLKDTVNVSNVSVNCGSISSSPPPQSPGLLSNSSSERQVSRPIELKILKTVDIVESLLVSIARDTLTSVVDDTISQIKQLSTPDEVETCTRIISKDLDSSKETRVREEESKGDDHHSNEILMSSSPTTPLSKLRSVDTVVATESLTLLEPHQTESTAASELKEKATEVAVQESNSVAHEQDDHLCAGENEEAGVAAPPSTQLSSFGAENTSSSSTATMTTATETTPTELKVIFALKDVEPGAPPTQQATPTCTLGAEPNAPPTIQATPTTVSLAPSAKNDTPTTVSQAPPTGSVHATPTTNTTGSSSSDSVLFLAPISTPGVPTSSTVTPSAKSLPSSLPVVLTIPTLRDNFSPSYKTKSGRPKTRIVPPRSCNAKKNSDDDPALIAIAPVSLTAGADADSSHPIRPSPLTLLPSQPHSPVPSVIAETLVGLLHMLCKSTSQPVYLTIPGTQELSTSGSISKNTVASASSTAKVSQISTPSGSANFMPSTTLSAASSVETESTPSSTKPGMSQQPVADEEASTSLLPLLDSEKDIYPEQLLPVGVGPLVATDPSLLHDDEEIEIIIEDNKEYRGEKEEPLCASDKDEGLPETTTSFDQSISEHESDLSCMGVEASDDAATDQNLCHGTVVEVDCHPCGQDSEQDASLARVEPKPCDKMEMSEDVAGTYLTDSAPSVSPEEKNDTVHISVEMHLDHSELPDTIESNDIQMHLDHSVSPDKTEGTDSIQTQYELPDEIEANSVKSPSTSEPIEATMISHVVSPDVTGAPSISEKEAAVMREEDKPLPVESPSILATREGEEDERESEALEAPRIPESPPEQEEKSEDSYERGSGQTTPEASNELLSNVNCWSNSERASPVRIVREQDEETASLCGSTSSVAHEVITHNQDAYSPLSVESKVPATLTDNIQPNCTNRENQVVDTCISPNGRTHQPEGEGDTISEDGASQASLVEQPSCISRSSSSPCEGKKRSRIGSRSPLFISLPAHYSSREKRVIRGPSERFRSYPKKGRKRLIVSLPLPLYWRRCQELNSNKILRSVVESSPLLFTPITPMVSKKRLKRDTSSFCVREGPPSPVNFGDANKASEKEKEASTSLPMSLVVSYPLNSLTLPSANLAAERSTTDKRHNSALVKTCIAVVEMSREECSSQILSYNGHSENEEDTQLPLRSYPALPGSPVKSSHNQLLSTPERLSTRRIQIGGSPLESEVALKSKKSLGFVLEKLSSTKETTATSGVMEMNDYSPTSATYVDFLSPDDYTCESTTTTSPHVVVVSSPQHSEESGLSTAVASEILNIKEHSFERDKEKEDVPLPEKTVSKPEAPDRPVRKSARLHRGSKVASSGKESGSTRSPVARNPAHQDPLPLRRKHKRRRSERVHHSSKDSEHEPAGAPGGGGQETAVRLSPSQNELSPGEEGHTSARASTLKKLLLSKNVKMLLPLDAPASPPSTHDRLNTKAETSPDVIPESPDESASAPDKPSPLPTHKIYLRRSEHCGVPYWINESPPPEGAAHREKSCLPRFELLLDRKDSSGISSSRLNPKFCQQSRKSPRKSPRKSRPPKRIIRVKSSTSNISHASMISPEVPECSMTKKSEEVSEAEDKSAKRGTSCSPLMSPLFNENAPLITSVFEEVAKKLSSSSLKTRSNETKCGITQDGVPIRSTCRKSSVEPSTGVNVDLELVSFCGEELSRSESSHLPSLSPAVEKEEEASAVRTSITTTDVALKQRKCAESAKASNRQSSAVNGSAEPSASSTSEKVSPSLNSSMIVKKSRSASPVHIAPPAKKLRLSSTEPDTHIIGVPHPFESRETTCLTEQERTQKCRSASPIRAPKREKALTVSLKYLKGTQIKAQSSIMTSQTTEQERTRKCRSASPIRASKREKELTVSLKDLKGTQIKAQSSIMSSRNEEVSEKLKDKDIPESKRAKQDDSKHSDKDKRSPSSNLTLQRSVSKSPIKLAEQTSPTKAAESPASEQRREPSSRSSVGGSKASSAPSCTPEREREREREWASYDRERERELLMRHPYSSSNSRDASSTSYRPLSPPPHYHESDYYYPSPHPPPPPPPPSHDAWHHRLPLLSDPPFSQHLHPPYGGPTHYALVSPPPYHSPPPPPAPHMYWSHYVSPYGPPPHLPPDRNPYDQRNYHHSSVNQRFRRQTVSAYEWYRDNL